MIQATARILRAEGEWFYYS